MALGVSKSIEHSQPFIKPVKMLYIDLSVPRIQFSNFILGNIN